MITRNTVLVLGAGASVGVGYPTGLQLRERICTKLGDPQSALFESTREAEFKEAEIAEFVKYFRRSHHTVDLFLAQNHDFAALGKFLLACELIAVEDEDGLLAQGGNCWYKKLRDCLGPTLDHLPNNNVKVITFNYDRSLEHFLYLAYHALGGRTHPDPWLVGSRLRNLGFIHAHGILSPLPWWDTVNGRPYGVTKDVNVILECSRRVLLADADVEISYAGISARELIEAADVVFFLGFGFDPVNMEKLGLAGVKAAPPKYFGASGLGLAFRRKTELMQQFGNFCFFENIETAFDTFDFTFRPVTPEANN